MRHAPTHRKYDGDASASPAVRGTRVRIWIEAPNVTAEVYIPLKRARELRDSLDQILQPRRERAA